MSRRALVFGASGFIGRWLIMELGARGVAVVAAVRSKESGAALRDWLAAHGVDYDGAVGGVDGGVTLTAVDFDADAIIAPEVMDGVTEVYNLAGAYRFGMAVDEAYTANVESARRIVGLVASADGPAHLVHVSGYRVGQNAAPSPPWPSDERVRRYEAIGVYEASKIEADAVVRFEASAAGVPWTIVNPSTVIGVSGTGESDEQPGLAATVRELQEGTLRALPGGRRTFVPVTTVDHLAAFMAAVPMDSGTAGQSYWVLDDDTPALPELLRLIGRHYGVKVPRVSVPVALLRRLPQRVTGADPETLSFLSSDRYPTASARSRGPAHPPVVPALLLWADHLAARWDTLAV